ncbi:uncharacterized protein LOC134692743 isoform X3 [Mytilus trossulus]|uniref:uncharacterized protein LOC134692743 isoform X3 n=1 Tax=Mytilus trossulus TaxID=6551 RepID=UPI00300464BF
MDSLIVDLDKVLDDFEAEESTSRKPTGNVSSEYATYLSKNEDHSWEEVSRAPAGSAPNWKRNSKDEYLSFIDYGEPYEPASNFDLSEADFAPSLKTKTETVSSKFSNVITNGHVETVENGNIDFSHKNPDRLLHTTKPGELALTMNGYHDNKSTPMHMHNENNSQMIDLHGCETSDLTENEFGNVDRSVNFDDTYNKFPIQVVDIFTPVSEDVPQIPSSTTYQQNAIPNNFYQSNGKDNVEENIHVNLNESVPVNSAISHDINISKVPSVRNEDLTKNKPMEMIHNNLHAKTQSLSSHTSEKRVNEIKSVNTELSSSLTSDNTKTDLQPVKTELSTSSKTDNRITELQSVKTELSSSPVSDNTKTELQSEKSENLNSELTRKSTDQIQSNVGGNNDNKKADEGYDSYDCLGRDDANSVLVVKKEATPTLDLSDVIFDNNASINDSVSGVPNKEPSIDSLEQTTVKALDNGKLDLSPNMTGIQGNQVPKETSVKSDESEVIGFGQEVNVDEEDMDDYLKDVQDENSVISNSLTLNSDADSVPPRYSIIDELPNLGKETSNEDLHRSDQNGLQDHSKTVVLPPKIGLSETQKEQERISVGNNIPICRQSVQLEELKSARNQTDGLDIQNMQLPSVEMGGARPKEINRHNDIHSISTISSEISEVQDKEQKHAHDAQNLNENGLTLSGELIPETDNDILVVEVSELEKSDFVSDQTGDEDNDETPVMRRNIQPSNPSDLSRPHSWGPSGSDTVPFPHHKRPNSLNIPQRGELTMAGERTQAPYTFPYPPEDTDETEEAEDTENLSPEIQEDLIQNEQVQAVGGEPIDGANGASGHTPSPDPSSPESQVVEASLGKSAPMWIPDSVAPVCMGCEVKFTFTKRRHHCRACGKVFCSACCSLKSRLPYMENKEARVCVECNRQISIAELSSSGTPNPNNPSEYCSVIPPSQQASARSQPPSVLVPASVLKREGSTRQTNDRHVMFSDGIRPGGDLTELDGSDTANRLPMRRSGRNQKKVEKGSPDAAHRQVARKLRAGEARRHLCLIPETGLPPVIISTGEKGGYSTEENPEIEKIMPQIKDEEADPVIFALNANLFVLVKIINLDCCVNRTCWCFTSKGMCNVGQDEIVFVLEVIPDEETIPLDILRHFYTIYEEAGKARRRRKRRRKIKFGNTVTHMGHTIFNQPFLDSRDHGGILYIRPTFQCLHKLLLPSPPYVFGILLQKWETPWAKVFPLRLLLRLGAEYRYYPCPLISVRNRKPVFFEIGHTIMNLLADFRNFQYMLPQIKGVSIHMEDKKTTITFPRNRYEDIMKVVSNSNEHVMALGASFSLQADSHLVCIQNDDGNYQTQAINIQNKPRKVTGASFVVFNGALKTSSGLKAKSSIVEDGLMVQITPDSMVALKQALKDMKSYTIECGSVTAASPDEVVTIQWGEDDKNINIGVKSPIDDMSMDGIESIHIPNATDYVGEKQIVRWTDVFFIQNKDSGSAKWEPVDLSRLAETLSNATCIALTPHLDKLKEADLTKVALRVNIEIEKVGYEIGANGERLPDLYMNDLDNELIPVIHSAASQNRGGAIILELIFHILD